MKTTMIESFHPDEKCYSMGCMLCLVEWKWTCFHYDAADTMREGIKYCPNCGSEVADFEIVQDVGKVLDNRREALENKWTIV